MANKRMVSQKIIDSDAFLDMPQTTQLLYFHLCLRTDDDGFVGNPKKIMRMIGSADNDLAILLSKNFIIGFESGVIVIKHHRLNNNWDSHNCKRTHYLEELETLSVKKNGSYTLKNGFPDVQSVFRLKSDCNQSLEENRREENNISYDMEQSSNSLTYEPLEEEKKKHSAKKEKKKETPWNSQEYINKLCIAKRLDLQIVGNYMKIKKMNFPTKKAAESEFGRNIKSAGELSQYPKEKRTRAVNLAAKQTPQWTLLTVCKYLNK